jgi:hypothetical protein
MSRDDDYFSRRAAEARSAAFQRDDGEQVEVAGHLAQAYAALARRRRLASESSEVDPVIASAPGDEPLLLRD